MTKIFILEDSEERFVRLNKAIRNTLEGDIVVFSAGSYDTAVDILDKEKEFEYIFLDHDLGGETYVDSREYNTGFHVAQYIADNNIESPNIIIHSMNWAGAFNMSQVLPTARHIPFNKLVQG